MNIFTLISFHKGYLAPSAKDPKVIVKKCKAFYQGIDKKIETTFEQIGVDPYVPKHVEEREFALLEYQWYNPADIALPLPKVGDSFIYTVRLSSGVTVQMEKIFCDDYYGFTCYHFYYHHGIILNQIVIPKENWKIRQAQDQFSITIIPFQ